MKTLHVRYAVTKDELKAGGERLVNATVAKLRRAASDAFLEQVHVEAQERDAAEAVVFEAEVTVLTKGDLSVLRDAHALLTLIARDHSVTAALGEVLIALEDPK